MGLRYAAASLRRGIGLFLLGALIVLGTRSAGAAEEPKVIIDRYSQRAVSLLSDPSLRPGGDLDPLIGRISGELDPIIAYRQMAIRSLGPKARGLDDAQIGRFVEVFAPFVKRVYVGQIASYLFEGADPWTIEGVEVLGQETRYRGRYALVRTVVHARQAGTSRDFRMNFKMINQEGQWGVYDLTFEDFSLVENYRAQFSSILANESIDGLIKRLRRKLAELKKNPDAASDTVARTASPRP